MFSSLLQSLFPQLCYHCDLKTEAFEFIICSQCQDCLNRSQQTHNHLEELIPTVSFWKYESVAESLFQAAKFKGNQKALNLLFKPVEQYFQSLDDKDVIILCLPSSKPLVESLATKISASTQFKIRHPFRKKGRSYQKKKNRADRLLRNEELQLASNAEIPPDKDIILLDDLVTSGSTLLNAKRLLNTNFETNNITALTLAYRERLT